MDHKPTLPRETRRILLAGGELRAIRYDDGEDGPVRVWVSGRDVPGLAMSRSVCDVVGKSAGVTSDPDVSHHTLTSSDAFLVLASDGLWEFVAEDEVCGAIMASIEDSAAAAAASGQSSETPSDDHLLLALQELKTEARARWQEREGSIDDISIIIAEIGTVTTEASGSG